MSNSRFVNDIVQAYRSQHLARLTAVWTFGKSKQLSPALPPGYRAYVIGDVHGRDDLLGHMFARVDADLHRYPVNQPVEIFLGDYVDRGPQSRLVVDLLIARSAVRDTVFLQGNHESFVLEFLDNPEILRAWRQFGGLETLISYGLQPPANPSTAELARLAAAFHDALPVRHIDFYRGLLPCFSLGDFFFVHAGVRPGIPLDRQVEADLLWIREDFLLHEEFYEKMIVHGHTPLPEPDFRPNRINIDTGAYATGRLTCLAIEHDRIRVL